MLAATALVAGSGRGWQRLAPGRIAGQRRLVLPEARQRAAAARGAADGRRALRDPAAEIPWPPDRQEARISAQRHSLDHGGRRARRRPPCVPCHAWHAPRAVHRQARQDERQRPEETGEAVRGRRYDAWRLPHQVRRPGDWGARVSPRFPSWQRAVRRALRDDQLCRPHWNGNVGAQGRCGEVCAAGQAVGRRSLRSGLHCSLQRLCGTHSGREAHPQGR
mmetsp:Transcript_29944/g.81157  ORF Transcript_29944/g.81157 Transcript_29944/m.81157 type:complete len:220 (+) Transcript_29944:208-867(+)